MGDKRVHELHGDDAVLRRAAVILRLRSKRPNSFWLGVITRILTDTAEKIEAERLTKEVMVDG